MEYEIICNDGFMVKSRNQEEIANMAVLHIMTMHPEEKVSRTEMMKLVKQIS